MLGRETFAWIEQGLPTIDSTFGELYATIHLHKLQIHYFIADLRSCFPVVTELRRNPCALTTTRTQLILNGPRLITSWDTSWISLLNHISHILFETTVAPV